MATKTTGISRDLLIHPGETISDVLLERGISQAALAASTGVSPAFISNVISGKKNISANFAMALEYALGVPKSFWLNLQANYDAELLEVSANESITEEERAAFKQLAEIVKYFQEIDVLEIGISVEATIIGLRRTLRISNIANLEKFVPQGAFRLSGKQKINPMVLGAWLRISQIANEGVSIEKPYIRADTPQLIEELKSLMLTCPADSLQESLRSVLARYGIAFSIVRHFKGAPVHGYVTKRENGSFQMTVTIRESWEDIFWFSLFHEIGHIFNCDIDSKKKEFLDIGANENRELLADTFSKNALIDQEAYALFLENGSFSYAEIERFAADQGVKPCIVIGRLQKEKVIPWNRFVDHKPRLKWA